VLVESGPSPLRIFALVAITLVAGVRLVMLVADNSRPEIHFEPAPVAPAMQWSFSEGPLVKIDGVAMDYVEAARLLLRDPVTAQRIEPIDPDYTNAQVKELLMMGELKGLEVHGLRQN
jgi:hypothetical protein